MPLESIIYYYFHNLNDQLKKNIIVIKDKIKVRSTKICSWYYKLVYTYAEIDQITLSAL